MADKLFFVNQRSGRKFQVISLDKEAGTITMRGEHAEFTEVFDKARFKQLGYELVKEPDPDAEPEQEAEEEESEDA